MTRAPLAPAVLTTWLVTAAWDFVCASALGVLVNGATFSRFWQGVASTVAGAAALEMGARGVAIGLGLHLLVALAWSALFVLAANAWRAMRRMLATPAGAMVVAAIYGPLIWLVMSLAVIPLATGRAPTLSGRWWLQIFLHIPFVSLPLVFTARRMLGLAHAGVE